MKKTAVITDATSQMFCFPRWQQYYGRLFGEQNLHVVTYAGKRPLFANTKIGNVWEINAVYHDQLRVKVIAELIGALLHSYDVVIHCDVDEFILADPAAYRDLAEFVEANTHPYVTAHGINIIELAEDALLDAGAPLLAQRRFGMRAAALSKTCLTTVPLRWAGGFHAANVFPVFSGLYNFHLKFADLQSRIAWHQTMAAGLEPGSSEHKYFSVGAGELTALQRILAAKPRSGGETEQQFTHRFLDSVTYNKANQIYQGDFVSQNFLFRIDEKFRGCF